MSEKIIQKIEEVTEEILSQIKDKTVVITEDEIENVEEFYNKLKEFNVECEKLQLEKKDFYYLMPKCKEKGKRIIAISVGYPDIFYFYSEGETESLKESIKDTILTNLVLKSKSFYQIFLNNILDDKEKNFFIIPENDIEILLFAMKSQQFRWVLKSDRIDIRKIGPIYIIAYKTRVKELPKYAFIEVIRELDSYKIVASFNIYPMTKEILMKFLDELYDKGKDDFEKILERNPGFKKFIEELLEDEM